MNEALQDEFPFTDRGLKWRPGFLKDIEKIGEEAGFAEAFHQTLQHANISVDVEGDLEQLKEHNGGVLFIGDHKSRWEFVAIADVMSQIQRNELFNVAKFYVQRQVYMALGYRAATEHIVPVYPRILARDRPDIFNYEFLNRLKFRKHLLSLAESEEANAHSLGVASQLLVDGGAVNIHPTGCVEDATVHEWRPGLGRIIQYIPDVHKDDVLLVPYSMKEISQVRLLGAIATRGMGLFGSQTMEVKLGSFQTVADLVDEMPPGEREDPRAITTLLREHFLEDFASQ